MDLLKRGIVVFRIVEGSRDQGDLLSSRKKQNVFV